MLMTRMALLIPFYNEEGRFDLLKLKELATSSPTYLHIYLIDDGSSDSLSDMLTSYIEASGIKNISILKSARNLGKAEALRFGLCNIKLDDLLYIGFTDADFSADPTEILRLAEIALQSKGELILGCRVKTGKNLISTTRFRYLQGELFSRVSSAFLGHHLVDVQCGLKYIPVDERLKSAISLPFMNRWLLDLELLLRLNRDAPIYIQEIHLQKWVHITGSKVRILDVFAISVALVRLRGKYGKLKILK